MSFPYDDKRYFMSLVLDDESELTPDEAALRHIYIIGYFHQGRRVRAERTGPTGYVREVLYYQKDAADDALLQRHQQEYPDTPMRVVQLLESERREVDSHFTASGELSWVQITLLDERGDPLEDQNLSAEGVLSSRVLYHYDADGELRRIQELGPDGAIYTDMECGE
ncbi:MAG: hypothetical protein H6740_25390 [Alphaproteobacteria bacterium]|nr:hypothetical protein [Alphaproteobacteria bacterium]